MYLVVFGSDATVGKNFTFLLFFFGCFAFLLFAFISNKKSSITLLRVIG